MGPRHRLLRHRRLLIATLVALLGLNGVVAWWVVVGTQVEYRLSPEQIRTARGHCYRYRLPEPRLLEVRSDGPQDPKRAESVLHEDGEPIGPAHSRRPTIVDVGLGRYSHREGKLLLSSSDNSDPRSNGRLYSLVVRARLPDGFLFLAALPLLPYLVYGLVWLTPTLSSVAQHCRLSVATFWPRLRRYWRPLITTLVALNAGVAWLVWIGVRLEYRIPPEQIVARSGHSFAYGLPERGFWRVRNDGKQDKRQAESLLYEDAAPLGPAHGNHLSIASVGMGKYSHWHRELVFSASDNSDPRTNRRSYSLVSKARLPYQFSIGAALSLLPFLACGLYRLMGTLFPRRAGAAISPARYALRGVVSAGVAATGIALAALTSHVVFWLGATTASIGAVYGAAHFGRAGLALLGRGSKLSVHPMALSLASVLLFTMVFEGALGYLESSAGRRARKAKSGIRVPAATSSGDVQVPLLHPEAATVKASRRGMLTLPEAWERRRVEVPGSISSYYWHEVLHVHDQHSFRRTMPFPPRADGVYRIMVVGDSLTYGQGVDARWIYPALIEEQLAQDYRVEVLNLGASGRQSEDILLIVKKFLPELTPDLVVYGVCHNDFLPSGIGQYRKAYPFPMPEAWKDFFLGRTRVANFVDGAYDVVTRALGLRADFFDDILRDFEGHQRRFARDVKAMNEVVRAQGLPPVVAMVFDQVPTVARTAYQVTQHAERLLEAAGMTVIETEDYYQRFEGRKFRVSQWEGHPDEEAHAIFAGMILEQIRSQVDLGPYRRTRPATGRAGPPAVSDPSGRDRLSAIRPSNE